MNWGSLIVTPSGLAALVGALAVTACVVWWIVRRREIRVWLPTLRVLPPESRRMPRVRFVWPPWVAFLCFLVSAVCVVFLTLRPREPVFSPIAPSQPRVHVFADFSPSVTAGVGIEDLRATIMSAVRANGRASSLSFGSSHADTVLKNIASDDLETTLSKLRPHRAGSRLTTVLRRQLETLGPVDRVMIVSDRDAHTWNGFDWRRLQASVEVLWVPVAPDDTSIEPRANVYINAARHRESDTRSSGDRMEWDVEIIRNSGEGSARGTLAASLDDRDLGSLNWNIPSGMTRVTVPLSWPTTRAAEILAASRPDTARPRENAMSDVPVIVWRLDGLGRDVNALRADDEFRVPLDGTSRQALVLAEPWGERSLEDPGHELASVLNALGFTSVRHDRVTELTPSWGHFPLTIALGGMGRGTNWFCPVGDSPGVVEGAGRRVWVAPAGPDSDFGELCECLARLVATPSNPRSLSCSGLSDRDSFMSRLSDSGARQVGGAVDAAEGALAWALGGGDAPEVLAFTIPLLPLLSTGMTHARLPLVVRDLLAWQGLWRAGSSDDQLQWPRPMDLIDAMTDPSLEKTRPRLALANVPVAESLLATLEINAMPPRWLPPTSAAHAEGFKRDGEDPLPWIRLLAWVVVFAALFEAIWILGPRFFKLAARRVPGSPKPSSPRPPSATMFLAPLVPTLLAATLACSASDALAQVTLPLRGTDGSAAPTFRDLSREVSARTSIDLGPQPTITNSDASEALGEPWLWTRGLASVAESNGHLRSRVAAWLARGGFLVIQGAVSDAALEALTSGLKRHPSSDAGWGPIPPDHELMRSFYLLDALPVCDANSIWRGYTYDGRLAILVIPYSFLDLLRDGGDASICPRALDRDRVTRLFVNLLMVALATDYKKDQIHLPEILKRLR